MSLNNSLSKKLIESCLVANISSLLLGECEWL